MTNIYFGKAELDFSHPLSADIIKHAAPRIQDNLTRLMEEWYDEDTRDNDPRRTHLPLYRTIFRVSYEKDSVRVTNELPYGGDARQFNYLYYGNRGKPICAQGLTRHVLKGYSANDRHKTVSRGGKKTEAGDLGVVRPKVLKFWSKKDGMWVYRQCVKPIGRGIITSFQQSVKAAVRRAIEDANWEAEYESNIDEELGTTEGTTENQPIGTDETFYTLEDIIYGDYGVIHTEKDAQEVENQQMTTTSEESQAVEERLVHQGERADGIKRFFAEVVVKPVTGFVNWIRGKK